MAKKINISRAIAQDESPMSLKFYEQHFGKIIVVIILLLCHIQLRYEYEERILSIGKLEKERNDERYTSIEKWGALTVQNKPEVILDQLSKRDVKLSYSTEPLVKIE